MSEKKKRKKTIYVDELVVKADKVVFVDHEGKEKHDWRGNLRERPHDMRDPWGFLFPPRRQEKDEQDHEEKSAEGRAEEKTEENEQEEHPRGWRWV